MEFESGRGRSETWVPSVTQVQPHRSESVPDATEAAPTFSSNGAPPLLLTKMTVPRIARQSDLLPRPELIARVQDADRYRLAVVCAPAGYGKTTLIAQAVAAADRPSAWLTLDDRDNDPGQHDRDCPRFPRNAVDAQGLLDGVRVRARTI